MTARKRNGDRCGNPASHGGTVCGYHGGNAPAVKAKARLRLEMAVDRMPKRLFGFADCAGSEAATKDALDRSGLAAKNAVSVEVGIKKPWEAVFEESPKSSLAQEYDSCPSRWPKCAKGEDRPLRGL